jgi:hypothetical protein
MIRKVKITKIFQSNKDKEGNPLTGQFGPYYKIGLQTAEYPTKYINGFNKTQLDWQVGQEVEIDLIEKGEYLNFKLPKKEDLAVAGIEELTKRVKKLEDTLGEKLAELKADICLELTGKFQTDADFKKYEAPHPFLKETSNPLDGIAPDDEPPF